MRRNNKKPFDSYVGRSMSGCWPWMGATTPNGYGKVTYQGKTTGAHRVAYRRAFGHWPLVCRHSCDNKLCCNPAHLLNGTHADNKRDACERGLTPRGERHWRAALSNQDVLWMRWAKAYSGATNVVIGEAFGVHADTVGLACRGKTWRGPLLTDGGRGASWAAAKGG